MLKPSEHSPHQRQLAAIMFADMQGFTALMQKNETHARRLRDRMREVTDAAVENHRGRIVHYYGDGMLALFQCANDAVQCAIEMQYALTREPVVPMRIGLHQGDVTVDEHGAYGDCVNVASRIESLSSPGAVLVSEKVFDEIKNQPGIRTQSMGRFHLKNVSREMEVFAILNEGLAVPVISDTAKLSHEERSIAVLPFVNLSNDPENDYFSDGVAEEILNALSRVDGLQVSSRTSSFSLRDQHLDVRQIGEKLGVTAVLEGSVRRGGNKVRINAQLVNTTDGYHVWSETFDGDLDDIFKVQDEISSRIVSGLKEKFYIHSGKREAPGIPGHEPIVKASTDNIEAYNLYLKGRYHWNTSTPEGIEKAIQAMEAAIQLDPGFAPAYCMLSHCYTFMGSAGMLPYAEAYSRAKDFTLKAIEIDPNHAESHLALASIKFLQNWDFTGAETSLQKAESLGLNTPMLHQIYGMLMIAKGDFDSAIRRLGNALKLEPFSLALMCSLADAFAFARRYDEALAEFDKVIELNPNFRRAFEGKGFVYMSMGELDKAIENLEHYHHLIGDPLKGLGSLGHAYGLAGQTEKALDCLERLNQRQLRDPKVNLDSEYSFIYAGLKDYDNAFKHLDLVYQNRTSVVCVGMIYCIRYPLLDELKTDPRFRMFASEMGIQPLSHGSFSK